jgi:hypothetical protein
MNEKIFEQAVEEWIEYCKTPEVVYSSNPTKMIGCDAYKKLLSMGYRILPSIKKLYDKNSVDNFTLYSIQGMGLVFLVEDIIGKDFQIPDDIKGNTKKMKDYTKNWLDKNMDKYMQ